MSKEKNIYAVTHHGGTFVVALFTNKRAATSCAKERNEGAFMGDYAVEKIGRKKTAVTEKHFDFSQKTWGENWKSRMLRWI